jgi:hypothetical protein
MYRYVCTGDNRNTYRWLLDGPLVLWLSPEADRIFAEGLFPAIV